MRHWQAQIYAGAQVSKFLNGMSLDDRLLLGFHITRIPWDVLTQPVTANFSTGPDGGWGLGSMPAQSQAVNAASWLAASNLLPINPSRQRPAQVLCNTATNREQSQQSDTRTVWWSQPRLLLPPVQHLCFSSSPQCPPHIHPPSPSTCAKLSTSSSHSAIAARCRLSLLVACPVSVAIPLVHLRTL